MGQYDNRDYTVGKGKPPAEYQFQKGRSGNPRGRRHKNKAADATLEVLAHEAVNETVSVVIAGRERKLPKKQALVFSVVNDALVGSPVHRLKVLKVLQEIGAFDPSIEDNRLTPEIREQQVNEVLNKLAEEYKRDEEKEHHYNQ